MNIKKLHLTVYKTFKTKKAEINSVAIIFWGVQNWKFDNFMGSTLSTIYYKFDLGHRVKKPVKLSWRALLTLKHIDSS